MLAALLIGTITKLCWSFCRAYRGIIQNWFTNWFTHLQNWFSYLLVGKLIWLKIAFFHLEICSILMPSLLESCSTTPSIPSKTNDLALSQNIVDGPLYLAPLVISYLCLFSANSRSSVKMWPCSAMIFTMMVSSWVKELMSKDSSNFA